MIEVEKKFIVSEGDINRLVEGGTLIKEKTFRDIYFDNKNHELTLNDKWLRLRDDSFEFKIPIEGVDKATSTFNTYEEITDISKIYALLNIKQEVDLMSDLLLDDYSEFANITTNRKKYQKGKFVIDLDMMDFGYQLAEVELLVESKEETDKAIKDITDFAIKLGLTIESVPGKVIEFLRRKNPNHYKELWERKVIY